MTAQPTPPIKKLEISDEDLAKVAAARSRHEGTKVETEWLFIAEFGKYFGWAGVVAIRNNEITLPEAKKLLAGARKVRSGELYDIANAVFIGTASARSKKPSQTFKKLTKSILKDTKADT